MAIAAAVLGGLTSNTAVAWCLRDHPGLPWRSNVAFPLWWAVAIISGAALSITEAGASLGVRR